MVLERISRQISGYAVVSVSGELSKRFVNLCVKNGIRFWNYRRTGETYILSMHAADYSALRKIRRRCGVKVHLLQKRGLPFRLLPLKKHPGLLVGLVAAIALYLFLSGHIWVVGVSGAGEYTEEKILAAAESAGVYVGARKSGFDAGRAAQAIMRALPRLSWATVNTGNCCAEIVVRHSEKKPEILKEKAVQNLIAEKTGLIRSIEAQDGRARVKIGEGVRQGDLLVTGIWDSNDGKEDWEKTPVPDIFTVHARGRVMAETTRVIRAEISRERVRYEKGREISRYTINFFGLEIPFTASFTENAAYSRKTREDYLYLLNVKMPISVRTETLTPLFSVKEELPEYEAKEQLLRKIEEQKREGLREGDEILDSEAVRFQKTNTAYIAETKVRFLENIAIPEKVLLN
ncbi:MAG: sporulation protein YqfD [Oscillospiraceae bacterium]